MIEVPFQDRSTAGRLLGAELATRKPAPDSIVLALPRGGLPVGIEVAEALKVPLDIVVVRKLGVPWQPELAIGAIAGGIRVLDQELIRMLDIPGEDIEAVVARESKEMERREKLYRSGRPVLNLSGRTVVLVDDGLATGLTMLAAARHVRRTQPKKLIIAVPVASPQACSRVAREADECICLAQPQPFSAVGEWYIDFRQVSDEEVQSILKNRYRSLEPVR
jgi:predicted phosphoribosyltransferase